MTASCATLPGLASWAGEPEAAGEPVYVRRAAWPRRARCARHTRAAGARPLSVSRGAAARPSVAGVGMVPARHFLCCSLCDNRQQGRHDLRHASPPHSVACISPGMRGRPSCIMTTSAFPWGATAPRSAPPAPSTSRGFGETGYLVRRDGRRRDAQGHRIRMQRAPARGGGAHALGPVNPALPRPALPQRTPTCRFSATGTTRACATSSAAAATW